MKGIIMFIVIFLTVKVSSQNKIYVGDKSYPSTASISFDMVSNFRIAKHSNGGYLLFERGNCDSDKLKGMFYIYLKDGDIIKCLDRGNKDCVNDKMLYLYSLTKSEINQLEQRRITRIRYKVVEWGSENIKSYVIENKKTYYSEEYNTEKEISELFN